MDTTRSSDVRTLVCGHICVDLVPELSQPPALVPGGLTAIGPMAFRLGGSVANTGGALRALGTAVRMIAEVGDDVLGEVLRRLLFERDGDGHQVVVIPGGTTSYSLVLQPTGHDRTFWHHVGVNAAVDGSRVDPTSADLLHLGYPQVLPALLADDGEPLVRLFTRARDADVTTSLDFCVLDSSADDDGSGPVVADRWARLLDRVLPLTDVISPSADDLVSCGIPVAGTGAGDTPSAAQLIAAADQLVSRGAAIAMVTAGAGGLALRTAGRERLRTGRVLRAVADEWADFEAFAPPAPVPVVSTVGAGDAATAGLLHALLHGLGPSRAVELAVAAAGRVVSGAGLVPYADGSAYRGAGPDPGH